MIIKFEKGMNPDMVSRLNETRLSLAKSSLEKNIFSMNISTEQKHKLLKQLNGHVSI